jgi:hypothetical protein
MAIHAKGSSSLLASEAAGLVGRRCPAQGSPVDHNLFSWQQTALVRYAGPDSLAFSVCGGLAVCHGHACGELYVLSCFLRAGAERLTTHRNSVSLRTVAYRNINDHCASASHHKRQKGSPGARLASMQTHSSCWRLSQMWSSHWGWPWTGADGGTVERMVSAEGGLAEAGHQMTSCRHISHVSWQFEGLQQPAAHCESCNVAPHPCYRWQCLSGTDHSSQSAHTAKQTVNAARTACSSTP